MKKVIRKISAIALAFTLLGTGINLKKSDTTLTAKAITGSNGHICDFVITRKIVDKNTIIICSHCHGCGKHSEMTISTVLK